MNPKKLARKVLPKSSIKKAEEAYRKGRIYSLQASYRFPAKGMRVIAVTGTNGKTTTCNYINEMLKMAGLTTAMYTTAVIEVAGKRTINTTHRTVPLTKELLEFFKGAKKQHVDVVVLEVTSMALDQHKLIGIPVEIAVMTNLTQDHLDYHKTMEAYAAAKARLFNGYSKPKKVVLNRDDEWYDYFAKQSVGEVVSYGTNANSTYHMSRVKLSADGGEAHIGSDILRTSLIGRFNLYNATAAFAVGVAFGLTPERAAQGVAILQTVPGRMQTVEVDKPFSIIVDYAHTPDALENVLKTLQEVAQGDVSLVFGATGDRDKAKRPIMGAIAAKYADKVYLTDDETYTEDPEAIRNAVFEGVEKTKGAGKTQIIPDRREAIAAALKDAKKGDVVVLAGIGHQNSRNMGGKLVPWDEAKIVEEQIER